jgi:hypothetical protein
MYSMSSKLINYSGNQKYFLKGLFNFNILIASVVFSLSGAAFCVLELVFSRSLYFYNKTKLRK